MFGRQKLLYGERPESKPRYQCLKGVGCSRAGRCWYVDETYLKVEGKWWYSYRAIDHEGNLVDSMLSEKRNMEAAQRFFKQAVEGVGSAPDQVTTDGHGSYPRAIRKRWAAMLSIGQVTSSIIGESKTIEG